VFVVLMAATTMLWSCGGGGPLAVQSVTLSNTEGGQAATTFGPSDHTIYAAIVLNRVETGLTVKLVWTAVDTSAGQNIEVASKDFSSLAANSITANVALPNDWPTGSYKMDTYLNGTLANTTNYTVQ
jgi:hypothetical protein